VALANRWIGGGGGCIGYRLCSKRWGGLNAHKDAATKMLLTVDDLPAGWTAQQPTSSPGGTQTKCETSKTLGATKATAQFAKGGLQPQFDEELVSTSQPTATYRWVVKSLDQCKSFSYTTGGLTLHATAGKTPFPTVGDASSAYTVTLTVSGFSLVDLMVVVRQGNVLAAMQYLNPGSADLLSAESFISVALAKLRGGSSAGSGSVVA
jgi:hypothetical protein